MNFLAHIYLSGDNPKIMVGNFIGDFVKGRKAVGGFEPEIAQGIELHRAIDEFTDTHPIVSSSKDKLREKYRHYSGVIVDVFYDHFLAANWTEYHRLPLTDFANDTYTTLETFNDILPDEVKRMLPYMKRGNWLVGYAQVEGIHRALSGMASRTRFISKMEEASDDLIRHYTEFEEEFKSFLPLLRQHCAERLQQIKTK